MKKTLLYLTLYQQHQLAEEMAVLGKMDEEGKPGILVAQIDGRRMVATVLSHERGKALFEAVQGKPWAGETLKSVAKRGA